MTTLQQMLADRSRQLAIWARIEAVGLWLDDTDHTAAGDDARIRFCIETPAHASSQPTTLWRPLLCEPMPDLLAEEAPSYGGISTYGGVTIDLLDHNDVLTTLFATDVAAATVTTGGIAVTDDDFTVGDGSTLSVDSLISLNEEVMRVDAITGTTPAIVEVTRAWAGTSAVSHPLGSAVFLSSPFLIDRKLELVISPLDSSSSADEHILGEYRVDEFNWESSTNVWSIKATSTLRDLDRVVPFAIRSFTIQAVGINSSPFYDQRLYFTADHNDPFDPWLGGVNADTQTSPLPIDAFGMTDSGEIIGLYQGTFGNGYYGISRRALLGTEKGEIEAGGKIRMVMVSGNQLGHLPGSFRSLDPGDDDIASDVALRRCHFVDLILNIMTSGQSDEWSPGGNANGVNRNYSTLPRGFGLGIPVSAIDMDSFEDVRRRTPQYVHDYFVIGDKQKAGSEIIVELLEPMGAVMGIDGGRITLTLPSMSVPGETVSTFDADSFLVQRTSDGASEPRLRAGVTTRQHVGSFQFKLGPEHDRGEVQVNSTEFAGSYGRRNAYGSPRPQEFDAPTMAGGMADLMASRGAAFLVRQSRPRIELSGDVDIAAAWDARPGSKTETTLAEIPDLAGGRGWTNMPGVIRRREHRFDPADGLVSAVEITSFGSRFTGRRIAPAAHVLSVATDTATVAANLYTATDAPTGLPTHDLEPFTVGDVVRLLNFDGTSAGGTTQIVVDIDTGTDEIELDGDFGGNLATDTIIVVANYDDCTATQQARFAFEADTADQTIGASGDPAIIFADE